jgi:biopolymer transport protein ExbD
MSKLQIDMTPMIDIVFQLLVFFVMTLNIVPPEGDLGMQMPLTRRGPGAAALDEVPPMTLTLRADAEGNCSEVLLNDRTFQGRDRWKELHTFVAGLVGQGASRAEAEVEIVADYDLKHEHVIEAITAVSGSVENGRVIKLIEKIKFAPPKAG